jgi:hypothetical protein
LWRRRRRGRPWRQMLLTTARMGTRPASTSCRSDQATYEEDDYTKLLMVIIHLPNGIKGLRMVPNDEGTKLLITGVAPNFIADVDHMVRAQMLKNSFEIRGVKDALLALRVPQSAYVRLFAEIELIEPVD